MSSITIPLPDEDLDFLRAYMSAQGSSAEAFLARQARNLRRHLQSPPHPEVTEASGIIAPEADGEQAYRGHLEKKHARRSRWTSMCCWMSSKCASRTTPPRLKC